MITFKTSCCIGLLVGLASFVQAADKTWTGKISDSMCGASHTKMMAEHKDAKTDRDCTLACVKGDASPVARVFRVVLSCDGAASELAPVL